MAESLVELVKRVAAEYEAATSTGRAKSEKSEKSHPGAALSSHISLISQSEWRQKIGAALLDAADLLDRYEERAAHVRNDGGDMLANAEAMAWNEVAAIWYRQHGARISGDLCAGCGKPIECEADVLLMLHGERAHAGHACIRAYARRWKREAAAALAAFGIPAPPETEAAIDDKPE